MRTALLVVFVASLMLALAVRAAAQDLPSVQLDWEGVEQAGCLSEQLARAEVEARLERDPFGTLARGASFRVVTRARQDASGLVVVFRMEDRDGRVLGERELRSRGADCRALDRSLALALALMIESPAARATLYLPSSPLERIETSPPSPQPTQRAAALHVRIEAATDALVGGLAPLSAGASLSLGLASSGGVSIYARVHGISSVPLENARVDVLALGSEVGACMLAVVSIRVALGGCVGAGATFVHARGHGLGDPRTVETAVPDVAASGRAELSLGGTWHLGAEVGVSAILLRPRFEVGEGTTRETSWEPWLVAPFLRISLLADVL